VQDVGKYPLSYPEKEQKFMPELEITKYNITEIKDNRYLVVPNDEA
jgi:hypothetical protein